MLLAHNIHFSESRGGPPLSPLDVVAAEHELRREGKPTYTALAAGISRQTRPLSVFGRALL